MLKLKAAPHVGDLDICAEMVRMGAAWAYREYLIDKSLLTLESDAKAEKRGLWGLSEATPYTAPVAIVTSQVAMAVSITVSMIFSRPNPFSIFLRRSSRNPLVSATI